MAKSTTRVNPRQKQQSQLRIIGGQWRSRKLGFTPAQGLRPTTDRVRETVFNWLTPYLSDARCADLFAGSGALGLEALSRGAAHCDFIDTSARVNQEITSNLELLDAGTLGSCYRGTAQQYLAQLLSPLDLVFIDPPFGRDMIEVTCRQLAETQLLAKGSLVYIESGSSEQVREIPASWRLHREKNAGGVSYRLYNAGED
jgi:16S rRNA (guanine966-N2)-methyltransferase